MQGPKRGTVQLVSMNSLKMKKVKISCKLTQKTAYIAKLAISKTQGKILCGSPHKGVRGLYTTVCNSALTNNEFKTFYGSVKQSRWCFARPLLIPIAK